MFHIFYHIRMNDDLHVALFRENYFSWLNIGIWWPANSCSIMISVSYLCRSALHFIPNLIFISISAIALGHHCDHQTQLSFRKLEINLEIKLFKRFIEWRENIILFILTFLHLRKKKKHWHDFPLLIWISGHPNALLLNQNRT